VRLLQKLLFTLIVLASFTCASAAGSADLSAARSEYVVIPPGVLTLKKIAGLKNSVAKIFVGSPDVADVFPASEDSFIFQGKKEGLTNLIMIDQDGEKVFSTTIVVRAGPIRGLVRIFHGIDHPKEFVCDHSNCDPLDGVGGADNVPAASPGVASASPGVLPSGVVSPSLDRRSHAPIGIATPGGVVVPIYPHKNSP
jgi:hypothetical protein